MVLKLSFLLILFLCFSDAIAIPAFPGAQGGGAEAVGGRGGTVIEVTNLSDSGTGSLRTCINASGPRTCVFRRGGTINILSTLAIRNPFLTIAGQTAPGGGIQISGKNMNDTMVEITTNNVVIRYIRLRKGAFPGCGDAECGAGLIGFAPARSVMLDHMSLNWNQDEGMGMAGGVRDWTFSYNLVAEGLKIHSVSYGLLGSGGSLILDMVNIDLHHNLTTNNTHRNPLTRIRSSRMVNNLWYNLRNQISLSGGVSADIIGNKWKAGPMTLGGARKEVGGWAGGPQGNATPAPGPPSMFLSGNIGYSNLSPTGDQYLMAFEAASEGANPGVIGPVPASWRRTTPLANTIHPITAEPVAGIESIILPIVGASRRVDCNGNWVANRDTQDAKLVNQYNVGTGPNVTDIPETEAGYGGFPTISDGPPCTDADHDGMPDVWETARGLNPNNAADRNGLQGSGYTNLEVYMAGPPSGQAPVNTPPVVSMTAPANGATVSGSAVTISANATDDVGVLGVQFMLDGAPLEQEDNLAPYTKVWNTTTVSEGSHTLTAVATDTSSNSTTSAPVTVTVDNVVAPSGGPVSHWRFDETSGATALDSIAASANHLTLIGGASFVGGGQISNALSLDGTTGYATDTATNSLNSVASMTISSWLKPTSLSGFRTILSKNDGSSPTRGYGFNINAGKLNFVKGSSNVLSTVSVPVGSFHHVAVTWNASTGLVKFYLDGVLGQTISSPAAIPAPVDGDLLSIGRFAGASSPFFGLIDDLRIYNSTLSDSEVATLAGAVNTPPTISLTAPAIGATVAGPVTVSATASDPGGGVAGVQFKLDGSNLGVEDTTAPYAIVWNSTLSADGSHQLGAVARDTGGLTGTSATRSVTVNNQDVCP